MLSSELPERDGSVSIYQQNITSLAREIFKVFKGIRPPIVKDIFQFRDAVPYKLRKQADFYIPFVHSVFKGTESIKLLGPKNPGIFTTRNKTT